MAATVFGSGPYAFSLLLSRIALARVAPSAVFALTACPWREGSKAASGKGEASAAPAAAPTPRDCRKFRRVSMGTPSKGVSHQTNRFILERRIGQYSNPKFGLLH